MFGRLAAIAVAAVSLAAEAGAENAGTPLQMPVMAPCGERSHPYLPKAWRGTYLMAPFTKNQLVLGDFTVDGSASAMRVQLYGLRHGDADFLIKGTTTYLLSASAGNSKECVSLGDTGLRQLPGDLLGAKAQCEGSALVHGAPVTWWKTPSASKPSADWIWFKMADRSPFRLMFTQPNQRLGVLGLFAFSYQVKFNALPDEPLSALAAGCESHGQPAQQTGRLALKKVLADMELATNRADGAISNLMPDLEACPKMTAPRWPDAIRMTAFMTMPGFESHPAPTEVLYDWSRHAQRTRMFHVESSGLAAEDALLAGDSGYSIARPVKGPLTCASGLPGPPRPNWTETGGCSCEAAIKGSSALAPTGPARIMLCPMTAPRVVWSWFSHDGRPIVFMETSAPGDDPAEALAVVDYHDWRPGETPGEASFRKPEQCPAPGLKADFRKTPQHDMMQNGRRCGACHLDSFPVSE